MYTDNYLRTELSHTWFADNASLAGEKSEIIYIAKTLSGAAALLAPETLRTGATQPGQYTWLGQVVTMITEIQLKQAMVYDRDVPEFPEMPDTQKQLSQIRQLMGLNILEIAAILQVSRPTVYDWLEPKDLTIRKKNQGRLNDIYTICQTWEAKGLGCLGSHLHNPMGAEKNSLFELLKSDSLNFNEINRYIENIAKLVLKKRQEDQAHKELLKKHGFTPASQEELDDRLNDIDFLD